MPKAQYNGQLRSNEIFTAIYNMIISQEVFADNIGSHQTLVDKARVDGGLFGDTKLYYATDVLSSAPWGNDAEAENLLKLYRPDDPKCQSIVLDTFRQICLTVDNYLTKRAWMNEGAFSLFNGVMLGWMKETKRIYDGTLYNVFVGTTVTNKGKQLREVTLTGTNDARVIAEDIANLLVEMSDYTRDFNDYGFLRSYAKEDVKVIWNSKYFNEIKKIELPVIFHKDGLMDKFEDELPEKYFGEVVDEDVAAGSNDGTYRSMIETSYEVASAAADPRAKLNKNDNKYYVHVFPGELIPAGVAIEANESYEEDGDVICKVFVKYAPFMSAFEVGTSFFNPKSLTENHYLTFGHNTIEYLENYPFITVKKAS